MQLRPLGAAPCGAAFAVVLLLSACACSTASRVVEPSAQDNPQASIQVNTDPSPNTPVQSYPIQAGLNQPQADLATNDPRIARPADGCKAAEQVRVTYWTDDSVLISWQTCDGTQSAKGPVANPGTTELWYWIDKDQCEKWELDGYGGYYGGEGYGKEEKDECYGKEEKDEHYDSAHTAAYKHSSHKKYSSKENEYKEYKPEHVHRKPEAPKKPEHKEYKPKEEYKPKAEYKPKKDDYYAGSGDEYKKDDYYGDEYKEYDEAPHSYKEEDYSYGKKPTYKYNAPAACKGKVRATGVTTTYWIDYSKVNNQGPTAADYASGIIHHVLITDMIPEARYHYMLVGTDKSGGNKIRELETRIPAGGWHGYPIRLGVTSDIGLTENTTVVVDRLNRADPDLVAFIGDLSYAGAWKSWTTRSNYADFPNKAVSWQPKWDAWGRLLEPLLSRVPFMHTQGEIDIEPLNSNTARFRAYNNRYPVPQSLEERYEGPQPSYSFRDVNNTGTNRWNNLFHSNALPGVFKAIFLTSYSPGQPMTAMEDQFRWLKHQLHECDRKIFPWLIVSFHAPWYSTYQAEFKQNEAMRRAYEELFIEYGVDIVFNGHVQAYERKAPLVGGPTPGGTPVQNTCGPVSLTVGTGGAIEGLDTKFIDTAPSAAFCTDPAANAASLWPWYQPQTPNPLPFNTDPYVCPSGVIPTPNTCFCFSQQPLWSKFREPAFGYGILEFEGPEVATWRWFRNQDARGTARDTVTILRGSQNPNCG